MKKLFFAIALLLVGVSTNAQEFKPVKLGLGLGYAAPSDGGGGIAVYLEPGYRINDQILIGLRIESAAMAKNVGGTEASIKATGSYTLNGQYYFNNNQFRPFVGLGVGLFANAALETTDPSTGSGTISASAGNGIGFYPRIGFDFGHFNFIFDYNIVPPTDEVEINGQTVALGEDVKNSYMSIKIGVSIGGGRN